MATPENGTASFRGRSGRLYTVDFYCADAAGSLVTFNPSGAAVSTSPAYWRAPEPVTLVDLSIATGQTVSVGSNATANGAVVNGGAIRWANQLNSLAFRTPLTVSFNAGDLIGLTEF